MARRWLAGPDLWSLARHARKVGLPPRASNCGMSWMPGCVSETSQRSRSGSRRRRHTPAQHIWAALVRPPPSYIVLAVVVRAEAAWHLDLWAGEALYLEPRAVSLCAGASAHQESDSQLPRHSRPLAARLGRRGRPRSWRAAPPRTPAFPPTGQHRVRAGAASR